MPWLIVRESVGEREGEGVPVFDPATPGKGRGENGPTASRKKLPPLLLFPAPPAPPLPHLATAAPALAAPVPDRAKVLALEQRLRSLSYMVGPEDGNLDRSTEAGLTAFQKVENLPRTGQPDAPTLARLDSAQPPSAKYSFPSDHLEVDIAAQVVKVVRGGRVTETLPTSTGNGKTFQSQGRRSRAVTPNGQYFITYKRSGWRRSPLGLLYRPAYFNGGIAFHGAKSVPTSPASHGCVRLPMSFADWFADNASPVGMPVYVYGNPGRPDPAPMMAAQAPPVPVPASPPDQVGPAPGGEFPPGELPPGESSPPSTPVLGGILGGS